MFAGAHLVDMVVNMRMNVAGNEDYDCKILHQQRKLFMTPMLDDDGGQYAASCLQWFYQSMRVFVTQPLKTSLQA